MDEKKIAGASYLLNFFKDVQQLTHHNIQYLNVLLELESRYGKNSDASKFDDQHKQILIQWTQNLRYYAYKCYISYKSIKDNLKLDEKLVQKVEEMYKDIKTQFDLNRDKLEEYVIFFNEIIVKEADLKRLLESSEEYINSIFTAETEPIQEGNQ
jgi:hypothetical protein